MFNKQLMQYQIFIKNPVTESALQKTFLPSRIKNKKCTSNYEAATKHSSTKTAVHKINSKIRKIFEKHPRRSPLPPKQQTEPAAVLEMRPYLSWEFPKHTYNRMTILRKTLEWLLPNISFTIKVKIPLQNLRIFAGKNIDLNFKIINFKIKIPLK